jgi:hypothetical protein
VPPPAPKWPPLPPPQRPAKPTIVPPTPTPPGPTALAQPSLHAPASTLSRARLVDVFFSQIPTADVNYFFRDARVSYTAGARADDGSGDILSYRVPDAQTLVISDVEFYAQEANPTLPGDQLTIEARRLTGFVGAHVLIDDRSPLDLYSLIDMTDIAGAQNFMASAFAYFGHVFGGSNRQPHFFLRAREGQTVRLAYSVVNPPAISVDNIGAVVRGYVIPSAILAAKTASG